MPIDLSGARPEGAVVPPDGPNTNSAIDLQSGAAPQLAPDGVHIAFSDTRTDMAEVMIIATLKRTATQYVTSDPCAINPAGPTSPADTNTRAWSDSSSLFEFKSFADGGADATYVQVGGDAWANPNVVEDQPHLAPFAILAWIAGNCEAEVAAEPLVSEPLSRSC